MLSRQVKLKSIFSTAIFCAGLLSTPHEILATEHNNQGEAHQNPRVTYLSDGRILSSIDFEIRAEVSPDRKVTMNVHPNPYRIEEKTYWCATLGFFAWYFDDNQEMEKK